MAVVEGVYDHVPAQAVFPYIVLEQASVEPWGILHASAHACTYLLDIYSRSKTSLDSMQRPLRGKSVTHGTAPTLR